MDFGVFGHDLGVFGMTWVCLCPVFFSPPNGFPPHVVPCVSRPQAQTIGWNWHHLARIANRMLSSQHNENSVQQACGSGGPPGVTLEFGWEIATHGGGGGARQLSLKQEKDKKMIASLE